MQLAGARLGPYEIEAALGAGGMGEVYRARDTRLGRVVALKVLAARLGSVPGQRERFAREARAISSVEHSNICPLYDVGTAGDVDYIVMQFVEGETLADRIARGPIPLPQALALARQIALGLEAAHERGVVHRDLKPANIQVARDGQVKLLDFGLARILDPETPSLADTAAPTQQPPTGLGTVLGTLPYMSPEQARGESLDRRTDIWSFGCVLYEMLSGRRAFAGQSAPDVMAALVAGTPEWSRLPSLPARVDDALKLCLRKDPRERLRDMGDVRLLLESGDEPHTAGPAAKRSASSLVAWSVAAAALALAGLAVSRPRARHEAPRAEMRFSAVTNTGGVEAQPAFSPDGRSIAYISNRGGQWDVYVGLVAGGSPVRVTNDANLELRPRWSPDGSRLAFGRVNEKGLIDLWVVPAFGGDARLVVANARQPTWSPDGRRIAYSSNGRLWSSDASGANARAVTRSELPTAHYQPVFSHDGRSLAFLRRRDGPYTELAVADVATGAVREVTHDNALALSPAWSADDRFIYFSSSRGGTLNIWKIGASSGEIRRITAGVGDDAEIDVTNDGSRLVFSSYRANLSLAELSLRGPKPAALRWLTGDSARGESFPRYSRDGRHIAYFTTRLGAENESIWVMEEDGRNPTKVVSDERVNVMPRWSPDNQSLVYFSRVLGNVVQDEGELRRVAITSGAPEPLSISPWASTWGDVAPDGRLLVRVSATGAAIVDPRTRERVSVPDVLGEPVMSRDGQRIAYVARPEEGEGVAGLWAGSLQGPRGRVLGGWVTWCAWAASGDLLAMVAKPDMRGDLWRVGADGRQERLLEGISLTIRPQTELIAFSRFDVHPDGSRIVIEAFESLEADISMIENVP